MNSKRITSALLVALIVSGLCTWLVARKAAVPPPAPKPMETMYVAPSRPLQAGEALKADNVELIAWPASNPLDGAHTRAADVLGRQVMFPLAKGQPIVDRDLSVAGAGTGLAGKIPDGMRAIALRSDEVVGVAGFLEPGSHLDVLVTYHSERSPEPVTATVLQDAVVIAAGHQVEPDPEGKPAAVTVVTLLLTPDQAQRAVLASTQGAIHFVLRNGKDAGHAADAPIELSQLAGGGPVAHAARAKSVQTEETPKAERNPYGVETVLAGEQPEHAASSGGTYGGPAK